MAYNVAGPVKIEIKPAGGSYLLLGTSKEGMQIAPRGTWLPVTDDYHGEAPATFIFGGKACTCAFSGVKVDKLLALKDMWPNDLFSTFSGASSAIGTLASLSMVSLKITERTAAYVWETLTAIMQEPNEIILASTRELIIPITALIKPDANGHLFTTVPSYIR